MLLSKGGAPPSTARRRVHGARSAHGRPHRRPAPLRQPPSMPAATADSSWPADAGGQDKAGGSEPVRGTTVPQTVLLLTNIIMGAGFVSIPFALSQGGWAALALLAALGCVFCHTGQSLVRCAERVRQEQQQKLAAGGAPPGAPLTYEDLAQAAFGSTGRAAVSGVMYAELLGICAVYLVLGGQYLANLAGGGDPVAWMLAFGALAIPTVWLPDLGALSTLSSLGVGSAAAVASVLAALAFGSGAGPAASAVAIAPATLPLVLGIVAFVYAGHGTFLGVRAGMAQPDRFPRALTSAYVTTAALCASIGALGYWLYGAAAADVVTANMQHGSLAALACSTLILASPFSAFAPTLEPVAAALQRKLWQGRTAAPGSGQPQQEGAAAAAEGAASSSGPQQPPYLFRAGVRTALSLGCLAAAVSLPYVSDLMALVGALLTMSMSLTLPAIMTLRILGPELSPAGKLREAGVIALGLTCMCLGAASAAASLGEKLAAAAAGG